MTRPPPKGEQPLPAADGERAYAARAVRPARDAAEPGARGGGAD